MYYYIIDPPAGTNAAKVSQKLQELITPMGISGEIAVANPARTAEELAYMGIDKGYSTIVAVGGEELVNTIATILLNESREKVAFGIIPLNAGNLVPKLVGVANNDLRGAVEVIKQRHLDLTDVVQIGAKRFMVTESFIMAPRTVKIALEIDQKYKAELEADYAHLSHDLILTTEQKQPASGWSKTLSIFGLKDQPQNLVSRFHGNQIRIVAHEPLPITIAGQVVAKTPTTFTKIPGALKLITARAILPQKTLNDLNVQQRPTQSAQKATQELVPQKEYV